MFVGVLCAVRGQGETEVVTGLDGAAGRVRVERRCADLGELLAAAAAGHGRLVVVSADFPHLDREAIAQLHQSQVRVLALTEATRAERERMVALGVDAVLDVGAARAELVAAVLSLADAADSELLARDDAARGAGHDGTSASVGPHVEPAAGPAAGRIVAVWGPTGAPGRSTLAINLAAELAGELASRAPTPLGPAGPAGVLIVDADTYGGTIAQLLGLLDESPGLAAAARAAGQGALDASTFARLAPLLGPDLRVVTGISRSNRWPELPSSALDLVWERARALAVWTVVDVGFCLEHDEALSYDTRAPRRNAATLSALEAADVVVVVGSGDPVGIQRLVRGLTDLGSLAVPITGRQLVVVNRVRAAAVGPRPAAALRTALERYAGIDSPYLIPDDGPGVDAATLRGATLREASPGSPARRAIAALAAVIAESGAAAALDRPRRSRWRRPGRARGPAAQAG